MASFEVETLHYVFEGAGIVIGVSYFVIFIIIIQGILQQKRRIGGPPSKLAIMMAAIFISCTVSHFIHIAFMHNDFEAFASNLTTNLYMLTAVDVATAVIAVIFLSLRKSYGIVIAGPHALVEAKDKLQVRNEQLHALSQIVATADDTLDLNEMTRNVLAKSSSLLGMAGGAIYLVDRKDPYKLKLSASSDQSLFDKEISVKTAVIAVAVGATTTDTASTSSFDNESAVVAHSKSGNIIASVMSSGKLSVAENKQEVARTSLKNISQVESLIVVPLKKNELVGVFLLYDTKPRTFIDEEITFLEAMGSQIGNAIEKATLYKESVEARRQAELLTDLMSHDIRNYNQITLGFLELITLDNSFPDGLKNMAKIATEATMNSSNIISNVKKLSKLKDSVHPLSEVNVIDRMRKAEGTVKQVYAREKNSIDISLQFNGDEKDYVVMADEFIDDVFLNLLGNAIKYDKNPDCHVDITLEKHIDPKLEGEDKKPYLEISISDNGRGIPDEKKPIVFDRFTTTSHGSGLGLSICKAIVTNRYSGKIWVENKVKDDYTRGSIFKIHLPIPVAAIPSISKQQAIG